jgi:hypothetical protein
LKPGLCPHAGILGVFLLSPAGRFPAGSKFFFFFIDIYSISLIVGVGFIPLLSSYALVPSSGNPWKKRDTICPLLG